MFRIYSDIEGVPESILCGLFKCPDQFEYVASPELADFFAFPTHYQIAYDYNADEFKQHNVDYSIQPFLVSKFEALKELSNHYNKRIITFYLRDPAEHLPLEKAIVFRSSLTRTGKAYNEFGYPANGRPLQKTPTSQFPEFLNWTAIPSVGFIGQSVGLNISPIADVKNRVNLFLDKLGIQKKIPTKYNFGYLHRRNAIIKLCDSKKIEFNYRITQPANIFDQSARYAYGDNVLSNQYGLCISGHGNYSFRFYEILAAGRIPLFINTDCVLPLEEIIDFKKFMVWNESNAMHDLVNNLLEFHHDRTPEEFMALQLNIKATWKSYFEGYSFYQHIPYYLQQFI